MIRRDMIRYDMIRYDILRHDMIKYDRIRQCVMIYDTIISTPLIVLVDGRNETVRLLVEHPPVWYGKAWYDNARYAI